MTVYNKFKEDIEDPEKKIIEVSNTDFKEIIEDPNTIFGPIKPKPPVSRTVDKIDYHKIRVGLFKWEMQKKHEHKEIHYDYQDKNYLEDMIKYKAEGKRVNELYFHGKKIILKDSADDFKI